MEGDVLLVGATGRVGRVVAEHMEASHRPFRVLSTRPDEARQAFADVHGGDLRRPETLPPALDGVTAVLLVTPLGPDEGEAGLAFLDAAEAAGVEKIVYIAIHNIERMSAIPHFAQKQPVRDRLLAGSKHVSIDANFFFQNDLLGLGGLQAGVYPLPIGETGVNSVDVRDVGLAAFNALTSERWDGAAVPVCGPERMDGPGAARSWSEALGRPIVYPGNAVEPFLHAAGAFMPMDDWVREDLKLMMEVTQEVGCLASEEDLEASAEIVGRPLRNHQDFAAETTKQMGLAAPSTEGPHP